MRFKLTKAVITAAAVVGLVTSIGVPVTTASATPTLAPIKIALITSLTGVASSQYQGGPDGLLARIALQNAQGGVNGHKIVPIVIDDQSSLTQVVTATQQAMADGAIGIVAVTAFFFAAYKYPQKAGIPVTGAATDGPEWGLQPNTNMFPTDGLAFPHPTPVYAALGKFFKSKGGSFIASYGYGISPTSSDSAKSAAKSSQIAGLKVGVLDTSIPFGGVNFTSQALTAKTNHVNALYAGLDNDSNFALMTALKQGGVKLKVTEFPTGYEPDIINTPAWQDVQGAYFESYFRPTAIPNAGTIQMANAMLKYQHRSLKDFPTLDMYESWAGADLLIKGLQLAGKNPTAAGVISALRTVKAYTANGLLPVPTNYSLANFGKAPLVTCGWFMQAQTSGFVANSTQPTCGKIIPGET
ncbi:MAG TPA: ABC transporter substrate-binding protein [Acidimicrobiales bacterium]|jgi:branched-chain amino acid transport system substrate-binding protein|nr:ABC transporter substrate-binding protein [Acidimicrobiales bacterium]